MKKGLIAISFLLTGALLITPISNAISNSDVSQTTVKPVKIEETNTTEQSAVINSNTTQINDIDDEKTSTEEVKAPVKEEKEDTGISKECAESILNKYINEVEKGDFTYTYQGDENTFEAIKDKGIRGYVFLPNVETDLAYLVDKDTGNIYYFHPSGYFELLQ